MTMQQKLAAGEFVILAEMEPPKGVDVSAMVLNAMRVKGKVDAYLVPEMSNAVMRMSSLGASMVLQSRGLETVMQVCCRDRNRLALQGDLLAANALGVANIMAVVGADPSYGDHHRCRAVQDVDLPELLGAIQKLQSGRDMAGVELKGAPRFCVGSTVNAGASGGLLDLEIEGMNEKMAMGTEFFVTPPIFDLAVLSGFKKRLGNSKTRIIPTVLLLKSAGMARYIKRQMDQMHIPEELIERLSRAPDRIRECVRIASELVHAVRDAGFSGVLISTIGWEEKLLQILEV